MSPRRKQSTKDLGELLNKAVPVLDEEGQEKRDNDGHSSELNADAETDAAATGVSVDMTEAPSDGSDGADPNADIAANEQADAVQETVASASVEEADDSPAPYTFVTDQAEADAALVAEQDTSSDRAAHSRAGSTFVEPDASSSDSPDEQTLQPLTDVDLHFVEPIEVELPRSKPKQPTPQPVEEIPEPLIAPVTWRKSTIPFREDQYDEIGRLLAEFRAEHGVQLTIAEFVRLGLDKQIAAFQNAATRPGLLVELYKQQQRESQGNENLKHSRSHGLGKFLDQKSKTSEK